MDQKLTEEEIQLLPEPKFEELPNGIFRLTGGSFGLTKDIGQYVPDRARFVAIHNNKLYSKIKLPYLVTIDKYQLLNGKFPFICDNNYLQPKHE